MITIPKYQPVNLDGPYRRRLRALEIAVSAIGHIAIAAILAYAVVGMTGAFDKAEACTTCAGGVR